MGRQTANRLWKIALVEQPITGRCIACDGRDRQERQQARSDADRARTRASAAVRRRKRLMQIDMDDVKAHVAWPHLAENRVEIGAVVVQEATGVVHDLADVEDRAL